MMKIKSVFALLLILYNFVYPSGAEALRIISTAPSITEIIYALDVQDMLVGVSSYCNYPEDAKYKEKIGSFSSVNMEKIILLKPDIVFTTGLEQESIIKQLEDLGIKHVTFDPKNTEELFSDIIKISEILNIRERGVMLTESLKSRLKDIQKKIPNAKKPKVLVELWDNPLMVAGKDSFVGELVNLAGGENIAYDTPRAYSMFSSELVLERNPDCIILAFMKKGSLVDIYKRAGWSRLNAIKNKRVYEIDGDLILRPGPRFIDGVDAIYKCLYEK